MKEETWEYALVASSGLLDESWYFERYQDVATSGLRAITHYMRYGFKEGRDPGPLFESGYYLSENPDVLQAGKNPLVHYLSQGWHEGRLPRRGWVSPPYSDVKSGTAPLLLQASRWTPPDVVSRSPASAFPPLLERKAMPATSPPATMPVRTAAFYLPQFHAIPENDAWWGEGFTEWTNVVRGTPQFDGHYQPHEPGELGYYDLTDPGVMQRQIELARLHGVTAFAFYAYWFGGKRLLERPLDAFAAMDTDHEFLVCWANENWTRTWDGEENDVLVGQQHSPEDDLAFISEMAQYLRKPNYFRIDGAPLLLVYRPGLLPDVRATAERWREWCRSHGVGEIRLGYVQSFEKPDPAEIGFDYAIEFPPNNTAPHAVTSVRAAEGFTGHVYDLQELAERSRFYDVPSYPLFRGTCPSWDNEARRSGRGTVLWGASPNLFREWMYNAGADTIQRFDNAEERVVFVNAWNEWAEGAHLEPDLRYGYQWLHAVRDVQERLGGAAPGDGPGIVLVTQDLHQHGAQMLTLHLLEKLRDMGRRVTVVSLGEGKLRPAFEALAELHLVSPDAAGSAERELLASQLRARGFSVAVCNTTMSGPMAAALRAAGFFVQVSIHEMPSILATDEARYAGDLVVNAAHELVFASDTVRERFPFPLRGLPTRIRPQGLYRGVPSLDGVAQAREQVRRDLRLPSACKIVLNVGYADHRKGFDVFAAVAELMGASEPDTHFVWVGNHDARDERVAVPALGNLHMVPFVADPSDYYLAADAFYLSSREDPYPSVVLEALSAGLPVVVHAGATGLEGVARNGGGALTPFGDGGATAAELGRLMSGDTQALRLSRRMLCQRDYGFQRYVLDLLSTTPARLPRVSVVVPNYNYGHLIEDRLAQIANQTYPVYELIVLDDASSDDSVQRIEAVVEDLDLSSSLVVNQENSGSVFRQWRRGVDLAQGDLVWIAEADDIADPRFLRRLVDEFELDDELVLGYCKSRQVDTLGNMLAPDYADYLADVTRRDFTRRYKREGREELADCLAIKNTIPNVSSVVFRLSAVRAELDRLEDQLVHELPIAGDWYVYAQVLGRGGRVVYVPDALNDHRRHAESVVGREMGERHVAEIARVQDAVASLVAVDPEVDEARRAWLAQVDKQLAGR